MSQKFLYILIKYCTLLSIVCITLSCSAISIAESSDRADQENWQETKQVIWWHDDELIKNAVISAIALRVAHPELSNEVEFRDHYSNVVDLLLLFDAMDSDRSLETLASLSPYYFGAHPGEIYTCLLLRKGKKIKPFLIKLLNSKSNECIARFKDVPVSGTPGAKVYACLSDDLYRTLLKSYLEDIEKNEWCVIEQ